MATRRTSPDMTTVFHAWTYDRFIKIQSNLRKKKLHRTNQGSSLLRSSFSNRDDVIASIQSSRESQPNISTEDFSSRTDPTTFTSIAPVLYLTIQKKPVEFFQHWTQQAASCPSPQCLKNQIQVQKSILVAATYQIPDHTQNQRVLSSA